MDNTHQKYINKAFFEAIIKNDDLSKLQSFLNLGADINHRNNHNLTPLLYAAKNCPSYLKFLINHKANIHDVDSDGNNVLAYLMNHHPTRKEIGLLVQAGADVNCYNKRHESPLMYACIHTQWLPIFIKNGAFLSDFIVSYAKEQKNGSFEIINSSLEYSDINERIKNKMQSENLPKKNIL